MTEFNAEGFKKFLALTRADLPPIIDQIFRTTSSTDRLPLLLEEMEYLPENLANELFREVWSACDNPYPDREETLQALWSANDMDDTIDLLTADERLWFDALPNRFRIYRGCDASRSDGLSWTTNRDIALDFARGHRGIQNPEPVVISGMIRKSSVLMALNERSEFEILAEFGSVKEKRIASFIYHGDTLHSR